jgi:hypothetical protein
MELMLSWILRILFITQWETGMFYSCHSIRICPYYQARTNIESADIIFLPYNYLIDPTARNSQKIDVKYDYHSTYNVKGMQLLYSMKDIISNHFARRHSHSI